MSWQPFNCKAPDVSFGESLDVYIMSFIRLPFRVRLGTPYTFISGRQLIHCHNEVAYPKGQEFDWDMFHKDPESWNTEVAVWTPTELKASEVAEMIRTWPHQGGDGPYPLTKNLASVKVLNEFLVAYYLTVPSYVRQLNYTEFVGHMKFEGFYVAPNGRSLTHADAIHALQSRPSRDPGRAIAFGAGHDVDAQVAGRLIEECHRRCKQYVFYELDATAVMYATHYEYQLALLFAVMALEAATNVLFERGMTDLLAKVSTDSSRLYKKLSPWRLSDRLPIVPELCLGQAERPTEAELGAAKRAVEIRNDIMHSAKENGRYKGRDMSDKKLEEGYKAARTVFEKFKAAVEKRDREGQVIET